MRKRIAFIVNGLYGGGAERVLQIVLRNLDRAKYDITLINHRQEHVNELYPSDIKYLNILKSKSRAGRVWVKVYNKVNLLIYENFSPRLFRKIYLRKRFDVEIAFIEGYATRIASGGRSGKKIAWVHTDMKSNPWADIAFRSKEEQAECYLRFDCVVCVSSSSKGSFDGVYRSKRSVVIYNPIDGGEVRDMASRFLVKRDGGSPLFATVGRLVPQKGYDRLVWVVGRLVAEGFDLRLWIVGEGPERKRLEKLIADHKLENIITLHGFQANPHPFVSAADWFVCSSHTEGYSMVVAEALTLGVPVLATRCADMDEHLGGNNEWGIIVDNNELALLDGMRKVLQDRELTVNYRKWAARRGGHYSLDKRMEEIMGLIEQ